MIQACAFCLSQDRDLLTIDESLYLTVYPSFNEELIEYINYLKAEKLLKLCWECQVKVYSYKKLLQTAHTSLKALKNFTVTPSGDPPKSESRLLITAVDSIDIAPSVSPLLPPKEEQNTDDADFKFNVELASKPKEFTVEVKLERNQDEDSCNNDTTSNNNNDDDDDDKPLQSVQAMALPPVTSKPVKRALDSNKASKAKSKKKKPPTPAPPKFSKVWASSEQAMRWHREELRRAREASLSFVHECDACERLFAEEEELNRHVGEAHCEKAGQYTCDMCLYRFPEQAKLEQHMQAHYVCYKCKNCSFECRELTEMEEHVKNPHNIIQKPVCIRCKNEFVSKEELKEHLTTCKTYKCAECDKTFVVRGSYQKHVREHKQDPGGIYCEICKVHYKASYYKEHLITSLKHVSEDDFKYKCDECDKKFPTSTRLRLHMFGNHKRPGPHPCKLCPKSYFDKMKLARHIANVHKIGPVIERKKDKICETCGKGFSSSTLLTNHIRIHTGERPWRCEECPAAFAQNGTYYMHMKQVHGKTIDRHGREKLTEKVCCDACGAAFNTRAGLAQHHNLLHAEKTDYQCETCEKYCRTAQGLQKHARTHAPPAPLPCHTCGKTFKTRGAHTQHIQKKHGIAVVERPFKCRSCDAAYSVQTNLYTHYKVKHLGLKSSDRVKIMNLFNLDKEVVVVARR